MRAARASAGGRRKLRCGVSVRKWRAVAWSHTAARGGGGDGVERRGRTGGDRLAVVQGAGAAAAWAGGVQAGGAWSGGGDYVGERRRVSSWGAAA